MSGCGNELAATALHMPSRRRAKQLDCAMVAATNRDLDAEVAAGRFRQDLYFRLSAAHLFLPPLRQRVRELPLMAAAFLDDACRRAGRSMMAIADAAMAALLAHDWPGNIREPDAVRVGRTRRGRADGGAHR